MLKNIGSVKEYKKSYLYFPTNKEDIVPKSNERIRLFYDNAILEKNETEMVQLLRQMVQDSHSEDLELQKFVTNFEDSKQLRFVGHCHNDLKQASKLLYANFNYYSKIPKRNHLYENASIKVKEILNTGAFYTFGRDSFLRPINVFNVGKISKIMNTYEQDDLSKAIHQFYNYIETEMLLPQQIENYVAIISFIKTENIDNERLESVMRFIGKDNPFVTTRRAIIFAYDLPVYLEDSFISHYNDRQKHTIVKIDPDNNSLWEIANKKQVEVKFGGNAMTLEKGFYWPPKCPDINFFLNNEDEKTKLITEGQYLIKFEDAYKAQLDNECKQRFENSEQKQYNIYYELFPGYKQRLELQESKVQHSFGPEMHKQAGIISKKDMEDDGFDLIFEEGINITEGNEQSGKKSMFTLALMGTKTQTKLVGNLSGILKTGLSDFEIQSEKLKDEIKACFVKQKLDFNLESFNDKDEEVMIHVFKYNGNFIEQYLDPKRCYLNIRKHDHKKNLKKPQIMEISFSQLIGLETNLDDIEDVHSDIINESYIKINYFDIKKSSLKDCCGPFSERLVKQRELKSILLKCDFSHNDSDIMKVVKAYLNVKKVIMRSFEVFLTSQKINYNEHNFTTAKVKKTALALINPKSGMGSKGGNKVYDEFLPYLNSNGYEIVDVILEKDQCEQYVHNLPIGELQSYHMILVFGGDGTVHQVLNGICKRLDSRMIQLKLACFSCGTNNFIASNQADNYKQANIDCQNLNTLYAVTRGKFKKHNVFRYHINEKQLVFSINQLTFGVNAEICKAFDEDRKTANNEFSKALKTKVKNLRENAVGMDVEIYLSDGLTQQKFDVNRKLFNQRKIYDFSFDIQPVYNSQYFSLGKISSNCSDRGGPGSGELSIISCFKDGGRPIKFSDVKNFTDKQGVMAFRELTKHEILQTKSTKQFVIEMGQEREVLIDGEIYKSSGINAGLADFEVYLLT